MNVLLAGVTGQLGQGLADYAGAAGVTLFPLVRPVAGMDGGARLARTLPRLAGLAARAVTGDVGRPLWGLTPDVLDRLAPQVDVVLNVAAQTNWAAAARELHRVNVTGALEGLRVARSLRERHPRCGAYVYASSVYVAGGLTGLVAEDPIGPGHDRTEYEHTKWLAEHRLLRCVLPPQPNAPVLGIARIGGLLGDSTTGRTAKRNSLYQLAALLDSGPPVLPVARGGRVDMLPRDMAARALLEFTAGVLRLQSAEPQIVHVCAGAQAPTFLSVLHALSELDPYGVVARPPRALPVPQRLLFRLSTDLPALAQLGPRIHNAVTGLRYVALDRVFERCRLARFVKAPLPAPDPRLVARLAFGLPDTAPDHRPVDRPLARFR